MRPAFDRGDLLFLQMSEEPIRSGEVVVFNIKDRAIPIVHRVMSVHDKLDDIDILTKGDNNTGNDRDGRLYADGQVWLNNEHIAGRARGYLPYVGWVTILFHEYPLAKYGLLAALGLFAIRNRDQS